MNLENAELLKKLQDHPVIQSFYDLLSESTYNNVYVVGGAVVDILEDREPKDWDLMGFTNVTKESFERAGYVFQYESNTSSTYKKDDIVVQFLKLDINKFEFKISQSKYFIKRKEMEVHNASFTTKSLVPTDLKDPKMALNSLRRIPHWERKGYHIHNTTYQTLLNAVANQDPKGPNLFNS